MVNLLIYKNEEGLVVLERGCQLQSNEYLAREILILARLDGVELPYNKLRNSRPVPDPCRSWSRSSLSPQLMGSHELARLRREGKSVMVMKAHPALRK